MGRLKDGRAVFVPRTVPGDEVSLRRAIELHRHFARGEVDTVISPGPNRVVPPCPHFTNDQCGGCQLQQLSYDGQLEAKRALVGEALRRIGKFDVPDPEIGEAIEELRYRTKISLAVAQRRERSRTIGLHPFNRPSKVFPLGDCLITDSRLMGLWRDLRPHLDLLPARLSRLVLRLDRQGQRHIIAESPGEPWLTAEALRSQFPDPESIVCWWRPVDGAARVMAGPVTGFPATAFEQVNPDMGMVARRWAVQQIETGPGRLVWDLYGGIGDTAALLAERGAQVVSVDADEKAVAWGQSRTIGGARFIAARAEDVLPTLPDPDAAVLNPPRGGLHWNVILRLRERPIATVVYISCDPATLARDLERLSVTYRLVRVRAFDLFPQTAHVETVAVLGVA